MTIHDDPISREALLRGRGEVAEVMRRHGLAGVCILAHGGSIEVMTELGAPWCRLEFVKDAEGRTVGLSLRASLAEFGGDREAWTRSVAMSAGFSSSLGEALAHAAVSWLEASKQLDAALGAEHSPLQQVHHQ